MLFAAIDIGSNAGRLYFANVYEHDGLIIAEKASLVRIPLRLGEDAFKINKISEERVINLLKTLKAFKLLIEVYKPVNYIACATAAMREAENSAYIVERAKTETGIELEVISGLVEARIVGTTNSIPTDDNYNLTMYIDVGGGSTEISLVSKDHQIIASNSFKIGTLRMLNKNSINKEWDDLRKWLKDFKKDFGKIYCIGSGGNINKINKIYGTKPNDIVTYISLQNGYNQIRNLPISKRIEDLGMRPDRADVIVPAAQIFLTIMKWTKIDFIYVPKIGLSDGLIHVLYKNYKNNLNNPQVVKLKDLNIFV
jgi:exopolyphosphatase / guanosine-5'-triphosphate,3'-diphosphate pyrophosphatase